MTGTLSSVVSAFFAESPHFSVCLLQLVRPTHFSQMFRLALSRSSVFLAAAAGAVAVGFSHRAGTVMRAQPAQDSAVTDNSHRTRIPRQSPLAENASSTTLFSQATSAALAPSHPSPCRSLAFPHTHSAACSMQLSSIEEGREKDKDRLQAPAEAATGADGATGALSAAEEVAGGLQMTPAQATQCEAWKQQAIHKSRKVNYLFRSLKRAGCDANPLTFIHCTACAAHLNGAMFHSADGHVATLMCGNRVKDFRTFDTVLTHELLHAYDHCRAHIDPTNLAHHACMEVRAASLSGDCQWRNEALIGNIKVAGQHTVSMGKGQNVSNLFDSGE
jgi:hypothetical protein